MRMRCCLLMGLRYVMLLNPKLRMGLVTDNHPQNIVAFGFLHGVDGWVQTGYVSSFGTMAGIFVAIMALAIPLVLYGERIRHTTALWRVIL
jgi:hypothetical protein